MDSALHGAGLHANTSVVSPGASAVSGTASASTSASASASTSTSTSTSMLNQSTASAIASAAAAATAEVVAEGHAPDSYHAINAHADAILGHLMQVGDQDPITDIVSARAEARRQRRARGGGVWTPSTTASATAPPASLPSAASAPAASTPAASTHAQPSSQMAGRTTPRAKPDPKPSRPAHHRSHSQAEQPQPRSDGARVAAQSMPRRVQSWSEARTKVGFRLGSGLSVLWFANCV